MKFRNRLDVPLKFSFHGRPHEVAAKGEWDCPARLAFAVKRSKLPLEPVGEIDASLLSEAPVAQGAFEEIAAFKNTKDHPLRFTFHNAIHNVAAYGTWECPARMASAVARMKLPLERIEAPRALSSEPSSAPRADTPSTPFPAEPEFSRARKAPPKPSTPIVDTSGQVDR